VALRCWALGGRSEFPARTQRPGLGLTEWLKWFSTWSSRCEALSSTTSTGKKKKKKIKDQAWSGCFSRVAWTGCSGVHAGSLRTAPVDRSSLKRPWHPGTQHLRPSVEKETGTAKDKEAQVALGNKRNESWHLMMRERSAGSDWEINLLRPQWGQGPPSCRLQEHRKCHFLAKKTCT
jgi:hypothetical protein